MPQSIFSKAIYRTALPNWVMYVFIGLWSELWLRIATSTEANSFWGKGLYFGLVVTIAGSSLYYILCSFFAKKIRAVLLSIGVGFTALVCMVQMVYFRIFGTYFVVFSIRGMGKAMGEFTDVMFSSIWGSLLYLLVMALPVVWWFLKTIKHVQKVKANGGQRTIIGVVLVFNYILLLFGLLVCGHKDLSPSYLYWKSIDIIPTVRTFGANTAFRLDLKYQIFGTKGTKVSGKGESDLGKIGQKDDPSSETSQTVQYRDNVMNIDFDALMASASNSDIKDMHEYFKGITPTKQNEYTGMFKGKNVIMITAEAFYTCAIDKTKTPTLYKMAHEGLEFTNYYSPGWGVSTLDGEYVNLTSLIPKPGVWSMWRSGNNNMYFTLGNVTKRLGYQTYAFHNNDYDYYDRQDSHFNLGYEWIAIGNGLELEHKVWPNSDYEMVDVTTPKYLSGNQPFSIYYLTVSGHANYNFGGNMMASWNKDVYADSGYSEEVQAYMDCQYELEQALTLLLQRLQEAGKLDDTLIVMAADHYPYGLSEASLTEVLGPNYDKNFEMYHNTLIMYNPKFEHKVIDKPCYSIDILPTTLNLMGAEYDSRLLMGSDILSTSQGLVIFSNRSWITSLGRYNTETDTFTPNAGVTVPEGYVDQVCSIVSKKFSVSTMVLDDDYYNSIFG